MSCWPTHHSPERPVTALPVVFQVPSIAAQVTCPLAMRRTSPQRVGPSPSGASSTRGSHSWSYISPLTSSEGKRAEDDVLGSKCRQLLVHSKAWWKCFICPPVSRSWAQCLLPYGFYFCWLANLVMNMIWLLLWDREYVFFFFSHSFVAVISQKTRATSLNI